MSVIKQISIHNGNSWGNPYDIGANAENVSLIDNNGEPFLLAGSYNVRGALSNILPMSRLSSNTVVVTDSSGRLSTSNSNISSDVLNTALAGASATTSLQSQINTINNKIGNTPISTIGDGTITNALNVVNNKTIPIIKKIENSNFYDTRCENIAAGEETYLWKIGNVHVAVICVKMKKTVTSEQTSIITLPSGFNAPTGTQPWSIIYNRSTGKLYQVNISTAGNINILNRGELAIGNNLLGQIVWIA